MKKIITEYIFPPIPYRFMDWVAYYDDYDGAEDSRSRLGKGATEQEAIDDLKSHDED